MIALIADCTVCGWSSQPRHHCRECGLLVYIDNMRGVVWASAGESMLPPLIMAARFDSARTHSRPYVRALN